MVDLVESGFDAAIRSATFLEQSSYALPIGPELRMALVCSPEILNKTGRPSAPNEITGLDGICFAFDETGSLAPWLFATAKGTVTAMPKVKLAANDISSVLNCSARGLGFAYVYAEAAKDLIE